MKKAVVLVVVIGVAVVVFILSLVALNLMTQQSRIAEHKIGRTKAYFAAQAGMVDALEQLRKGTQPIPTIGNPTTYSLPTAINTYTVNVEVVARGDGDCDVTAPSDNCVFITAVKP